MNYPQLEIRKGKSHLTAFTHCLICSTAPINAENKYREDLSSKDSSYSIDEIKSALRIFIKEKWEESGKDVLDRINIVLDIHGFNVPLKSVEKNYESLFDKFQSDVKGAKTFDDFVLFINFSWPAEQVFTSQRFEWIKAMPFVLWIFIGISITLLLANTLSWLALILVGMFLLLIFLRLVVYFRDRERATNYGVFDAVDLVRWIQVILEEIVLEESANRGQTKEDLKHFGRANLRFIAHSMGCFVVTNTIRILSDVFDSHSIERWKKTAPNGPFETEPKSTEDLEKDEVMQNLGTLLKLKTLVIASPDIPIWAITSGRSNFLKSCLRRFEEAFLFTNDADLVLRLASTAANYFVFPSSSRVGGYRLGNLTTTIKRNYGMSKLGNNALGIRAFTRNISLTDKPFNCEEDIKKLFAIVDCTDYKDQLIDQKYPDPPQRLLSAFTANNCFTNGLNYILTAIKHFSGIWKLDSHGGYFRGEFCRDLIYSLALYGKKKTQEKSQRRGENWEQKLKDHQMAWIEAIDAKD